MIIKLKFGVDQLLFGMKQDKVAALYGKADKQFKDDENNLIYVYNEQKWRLTFYEDEDLRLGYIIAANPDLELFGKKIIGRPTDEVIDELKDSGIDKWENEDFDLAENRFNEDNWLLLQSEFGRISKVELGAIIKDNDEFDWKYNEKA